MAPPVNLSDLQDVVGKYVGQHNVVVAAGPFTAAALTRAFITKNKAVSMAMVAGGAWMAVQSLSTPMLKLMNDQFGYLQSIFGMHRG
jgi:hypothetical protein